MAQRRMFSKDIVGTDSFLEMPISSQLLYFQLGMEADDDGFVGSPKKVARIIGAGGDDLKILSAKRFILIFPSGIVVIKHWKMNNYIQADRYHETKYTDEKNTLLIKENGSYTECIQNVSKMDTQVRLGKASLDKNILRPKKSVARDSVDDDKPMTSEQFKQWCHKSNQRHIRIIGDYAVVKNPNYNTLAQWNIFLKRNLRPARDLSPFTGDQIEAAYKKMKEQNGTNWLKKYTLETIIKYLEEI
jgi:hypothetical protein